MERSMERVMGLKIIDGENNEQRRQGIVRNFVHPHGFMFSQPDA